MILDKSGTPFRPSKEHQRSLGPVRERLRPGLSGSSSRFVRIGSALKTDAAFPAVNFFGNVDVQTASNKVNPDFGIAKANLKRVYLFFTEPYPSNALGTTKLYILTSCKALYSAALVGSGADTFTVEGDLGIYPIFGMGGLTPQTLTWANQGTLVLGPGDLRFSFLMRSENYVVTTTITAGGVSVTSDDTFGSLIYILSLHASPIFGLVINASSHSGPIANISGLDLISLTFRTLPSIDGGAGVYGYTNRMGF